MPAKRKLDDNLIVQRYYEGLTCYDLAKEFNCGFKTILRRLHQYNVKIRPVGLNKLSQEDIQNIINEYQTTDIDATKLSLKYKVHYSKITLLLRSNGVSQKPRKKRVIFTEDDEKEIIRLYITKEKSFLQICKIYCQNVDRIKDILKKNNINYIPLNHAEPDIETCKKAINLYSNEELTLHQVADKLHIPYQRVRKIMMQNNIHIKTRKEVTSLEYKVKRNPTISSYYGYRGKYKNFPFQSLSELMFIIFLDNHSLFWESGASIENCVVYFDTMKSKFRRYYPDFIVENKYIIEIKPKFLWKNQNVIDKFKATNKLCKKFNYHYLILYIEPNQKIIKEYYKAGNIIFRNKNTAGFKKFMECLES